MDKTRVTMKSQAWKVGGTAILSSVVQLLDPHDLGIDVMKCKLQIPQ